MPRNVYKWLHEHQQLWQQKFFVTTFLLHNFVPDISCQATAGDASTVVCVCENKNFQWEIGILLDLIWDQRNLKYWLKLCLITQMTTWFHARATLWKTRLHFKSNICCTSLTWATYWAESFPKTPDTPLTHRITWGHPVWCANEYVHISDGMFNNVDNTYARFALT